MRQTIITLASLALLAGSAIAQAPTEQPATTLNDRLTGDLVPTHDPVIIREGGTYHVFSTGHGDRLIETGPRPTLSTGPPASPSSPPCPTGPSRQSPAATACGRPTSAS